MYKLLVKNQKKRERVCLQVNWIHLYNNGVLGLVRWNHLLIDFAFKKHHTPVHQRTHIYCGNSLPKMGKVSLQEGVDIFHNNFGFAVQVIENFIKKFEQAERLVLIKTRKLQFDIDNSRSTLKDPVCVTLKKIFNKTKLSLVTSYICYLNSSWKEAKECTYDNK